MTALLDPRGIKPAPDLDRPRKVRASEADEMARLIADLHGAIVIPGTERAAVLAAMGALLGVLERAKGMRLPCLIVPPLAEAGGAHTSPPLRFRADRSPVRSTRTSLRKPDASLTKWRGFSTPVTPRPEDGGGAWLDEHSLAFNS